MFRLNCEALYAALDEKRLANSLFWWQVAKQAGLSPATFTRLGVHSGAVNGDSLCKLLGWLGETDLKPYIIEETS